MGVANQRSIAWILPVMFWVAPVRPRAVLARGGRLALTYQSRRIRPRVEALLAPVDAEVALVECDVAGDDGVTGAMQTLAAQMPILHGLVHSIAYAPADDLQGSFVETTRTGFAVANDISSYSLIAAAREARALERKAAAEEKRAREALEQAERDAALKAEQAAREIEAAAEAERAAALEAERKLARDARYAARKARK